MAARATWKGIMTFGMVSIPVKVYTATTTKDISFRMLHADCKGRVREKKFCPSCERDIEYAEITKGYEYGKDQYVVVNPDDFEKLPLPNKDSIDISTFVHIDEIDPTFYDKAYYIEPEEAAKKPFTLFLRAMAEKNVLAIGKIALRTKERMCCLRPVNGALMMSTLLYPDEIKVEMNKPLADVKISDQEMGMACTLIDMMTSEFEPDNFTDNYRDALLQLIEAKVEGREIEEIPAAPEGKVIDLMAALQASMESLKSEGSKGKEKEKEKEKVILKAAAKTAAEPKIGTTKTKTASKRKTG